MDWPATVTLDAWVGDDEPVTGPLRAPTGPWRPASHQRPPPVYMAPPKIDPNDWRCPKVGWGLILPYREDLSDAQMADAVDAPEPIRELLRRRAPAPVLRFRPKAQHPYKLLRACATGKDVDVNGAGWGVGAGQLPYYLLIYGSPADIPWRLQYILNTHRAVGRLDLRGEALENYVAALLRGWMGSAARVGHAVVWATDYHRHDITHLMRNAIAAKVHEALAGDDEIGANAAFLDGGGGTATRDRLVAEVAARNPALVVTTSHGKTGPLDDPAALRAGLGLPVDQARRPLRVDDLLAVWQPDGAIWYAHACCSAGSDELSSFRDLLEPGSRPDRVVRSLEALGAGTAPLPTALLGAARPARGFIGHVEPTFDWTLIQKDTGQFLTDGLCRSLHYNLYQRKRQPLGRALRGCYDRIAPLYTQAEILDGQADRGDRAARALALVFRLVANDLRGLVLLGDPTATLP